MNLNKLLKLATKFQTKLADDMETKDVYEFQTLLDSMFPPSEKNKIASQIANEVEDDVNSLKIDVNYDKMHGVSFNALVNGVDNLTAQKVLSSLKSKIDTACKSDPKITNSKYLGWVVYPKK